MLIYTIILLFYFLFQCIGGLSLFSNRLSPIPIIVKCHLQGIQLLMLDSHARLGLLQWDLQVNHALTIKWHFTGKPSMTRDSTPTSMFFMRIATTRVNLAIFVDNPNLHPYNELFCPFSSRSNFRVTLWDLTQHLSSWTFLRNPYSDV